ncbi:MAG: DUF2795 domain-containing protein [Chloroflexi bacterium]|nr:DUF2795 domain-containing protein [Chloroflexota bacterium]
MTQKRDSDKERADQSKQGGTEEYTGLAQKGGQHAAQTPGSASNLAMHFKGVDFPATKQDLLKHVEQSNAPDQVRQMLEGLPEGERFGSMADLMAAWGREHR